jgi:hypothetical protein
MIPGSSPPLRHVSFGRHFFAEDSKLHWKRKQALWGGGFRTNSGVLSPQAGVRPGQGLSCFSRLPFCFRSGFGGQAEILSFRLKSGTENNRSLKQIFQDFGRYRAWLVKNKHDQHDCTLCPSFEDTELVGKNRFETLNSTGRLRPGTRL